MVAFNEPKNELPEDSLDYMVSVLAAGIQLNIENHLQNEEAREIFMCKFLDKLTKLVPADEVGITFRANRLILAYMDGKTNMEGLSILAAITVTIMKELVTGLPQEAHREFTDLYLSCLKDGLNNFLSTNYGEDNV